MILGLTALVLMLTAATMGLSLAHALEFPGKRRLDEAAYRRVQTIYYPGFTLGGLIGEFGALLTAPLLVALTPPSAPSFPWLLAAVELLLATHLTYWICTHPVNKAWLEDAEFGLAGRIFFRPGDGNARDWRRLRDLWEWSHVARATFATLALLSLIIAALVG